jgi:sec-independent protein translocase protein TatC
LASPYIIYQLFRFVSPALYANERRYVVQMTFWGYLLFMLGVLLNYFLIFPLTFRFLGTYQVSALVENTITLTSYVDTLMMLSLMMGIVFEIPILSWLFARLGFLTSSFMKKYRRHAIVLILIVAAFITPTSDVFTLTLVSLPMYLLYEISISVVKRTEPNQKGGVA